MVCDKKMKNELLERNSGMGNLLAVTILVAILRNAIEPNKK